MNAPRLSLVIPAYNEAKLLPLLLDSVAEARALYRHGPEATEVIVANNGSTDGTAGIAARRGCRVVNVVERRIATVRNGGAAIAHGATLAFVDADALIHPETFNAIDDSLASGKVVAGSTGVRLERWSVGIALTYAMFVPLILILRMDSGVVFCRRDDFEAVGGYDERRDFAEDVQLLWDLRRLGKKRRQRLVRLTAVRAVASMRKFDTYGDWHYFSRLFHLVPRMIFRPASTTEFARRYWYGDDR